MVRALAGAAGVGYPELAADLDAALAAALTRRPARTDRGSRRPAGTVATSPSTGVTP